MVRKKTEAAKAREAKWRKDNKDKVRASYARWKKANLEVFKARSSKYSLAYRTRIRIKCFEILGKECACCGEDHIEFLVVDHVGGGGNKHRKDLGSRAKTLLWLIKEVENGEDISSKFRTLCCNCNASLGCYGYCPHEQ